MYRLRNNFRAAFTLVELMMGLLVMSIIFAALAGLSLALSKGWSATSAQDSLQVARRQTSTQMYYNVRSAKFIGAATADNSNTSGGSSNQGAVVIFWKGDKDAGTVMYAYQIGVIEHDIPTSTLRLWQLPQSASAAMTEFKGCDVDDSGDVEKFKKMNGVTCQVIGRNVSSVSFKMLPVTSTRQSQMLEFQIRYKSGEQEQLEYGTATVRVPQAPVAN